MIGIENKNMRQVLIERMGIMSGKRKLPTNWDDGGRRKSRKRTPVEDPG